jgi:hypothetical protein
MAGLAELGPMTQIELDGEANSTAEAVLRGLWRAGVAVLGLLLAMLAWLAASGELYKPGDDARIRFRVTNTRGEGVQELPKNWPSIS